MNKETPRGRAGQAWDASLYDSRHAFVWKLGEAVVELLAPRPGERILDVGSGTGHLTARLAAAGAAVLGIDASAEMVAGARAAYPGLRFEEADVRSFSTAQPFDAVFSNATLHWVRPPEQAAARILAALRPGGRFAAELGGRRNVQTIVRAVLETLAERGIPCAGEENYYPALGEYASLLEAVGFRVTEAFHFPRPTPLEGGGAGLRGWLLMFGGRFLTAVPEGERESVLATIEERARPVLYRDGQWSADYWRLRLRAERPE